MDRADTGDSASESSKEEGCCHGEVDIRATVFHPWALGTIPVRAFHASWASFFLAMFATFAPAALTVPIRDTLNLDESHIALGNALTLAGTAICRILMGSLCDAFGPKVVMITILLTTVIPLFFITIVDQPLGHLICRPLIGLSMGCQTVSLYWCALMFVEDVVGESVSVTMGLAESGFGCAQILMPALFVLLSRRLEPFVAWRLALILPALAQLVLTVYVAFGTKDQSARFESTSRRRKGKERFASRRRWLAAVGNYRTWIFALCYGVVLGIGLSVYNIITAYYFDNFDISFAAAGVLGSLAGFVNMVYMPISGLLSDFIARRRGMRGRLWFVMVNMIAIGISLVLLSEAHNSLTLSIVAMQFVLAFIALFAAALFSATPFVSHRALGLVQGIIGSGANVIGAVLQEMLFNKARLDTHVGFFWAGITTLVTSSLLLTVYYPMWGGICRNPRPGAHEEEYYLSEYTHEEIQMGLAEKSVRYAQQASAERSRNATE